MRKKIKPKKSSPPKFFSAFFGFILWILRITLPAVVLSAVFFLSFQGVRQYLFADDFFRLLSVNTSTNGILPSEAISRAAGISLGDNVLAIDLQRVTRNLQSDPRISEAAVTRILPNQISIEIKERREFLRIRLPSDGKIMVMDEDGFLLFPAALGPAVPVFEDLRPESGKYFTRDRYQDRDMLRAIFQMKELAVREPMLKDKKIQFIKVDSSKRVQIGFEGGFEIRVSENYAEEMKKLDPLRQLLEKDIETLEYLDLRFQDVVARKKQQKKIQGPARPGR